MTVCEKLRPALIREYERDGMGFMQPNGKWKHVLVHTLHTDIDGDFIVEFEDGTLGGAIPDDIRFLDSKAYFDEYRWEDVE